MVKYTLRREAPKILKISTPKTPLKHCFPYSFEGVLAKMQLVGETQKRLKHISPDHNNKIKKELGGGLNI